MYLYHGIRHDIVGNKIVPFARLYKSSEELNIGKGAKFPNHYRREHQKVGVLDCLKRDVIFLTPIPPKILNDEIKRRVGVGFEGGGFYKIDINKLEREKLCIYLAFDQEEEGEFFSVNDETLANFEEYMDYSQDAKDYWENVTMHSNTERSLLFAGTYLFLYKGDIDLADCERIDL
ncbi:MAG: hypothetical protein ACRCWM_02175 [Sarcina sp.]